VSCGKEKKKREKRAGGVGRKRGKGEGRGEKGFLFKFFSNSFFKLLNFTQTRNHAFES
jgi:hypothetical protein